MTATVTLPTWLFVLILLFAGVTFASHFLFPSVRWLLRRRAERVVAALNQRLERPIQPFKLVRRYDLIQRLTYDREVVDAALSQAREQGIPEEVAFERARRYAREIVPAFSASAYFGIAFRAARGLSRMLYDVREEGAEALDLPPEATVVYVMNHRSNMDYVLVTYLSARRTPLSYAVGEWARVWPLSALIRAMGAFFIRRRSRTPLYRRVLARYVQLATEAGVAQALYPEGGLSRDGTLGTPKVGLLKYLIDGAVESGRPLVFVPVALNYDRVLEDENLIAAQSGQRGGRFDARMSVILGFVLRLLWLRLRNVQRRYGQAGVRFGAPIVMDPAAPPDPEALAQDAMERIAAVVPVLPVPLAALTLDTAGEGAAADLAAAGQTLLDRMGETGNAAALVAKGLDRLERRGLVQRDAEGRVTVPPGAEPQITFYANSLRHRLDRKSGAKEADAATPQDAGAAELSATAGS